MNAFQLLLILHSLSETLAFRVSVGATRMEIRKIQLEENRFELVALDDENERERIQHFLECLNSVDSSEEDEQIDWYCDDEREVVCSLPRRFVHDQNLLHKGIGVLLMRKPDEVYMHMRSKKKRTWPGLLDCMIGGLGVTGSSSAATLVRELKEELNLDVNVEPNPIIQYVGTTTISTEQNRCIVENFIVQLADGDEGRELIFGDGEVEWGRWVGISELTDIVNRDSTSFVPSGLQCFRFIQGSLH